jgi:hypothetical protein
MSRRFLHGGVCGFWGAAVGAAAQGVPLTWWLFWAVAFSAFSLVAYWHRPRNGGHAHA